MLHRNNQKNNSTACCLPPTLNKILNLEYIGMIRVPLCSVSGTPHVDKMRLKCKMRGSVGFVQMFAPMGGGGPKEWV